MRRFIFSYTVLLILFLLPEYLPAVLLVPEKPAPETVVIIIDRQTYRACAPEVQNYRQSIEEDGLGCYLLEEDWQNPEEIRERIKSLYQKDSNLQGLILIGRIPVPMIRDAQHLTTAFKMDQENLKRFPLEESSVPSDRFYDDLDLQFESLGQDSANPLLFYYRLTADSPQRISREFYSGRIIPPPAMGAFDSLLTAYLRKLVEQRKERAILNRMLLVTGHGYHSESLTAWSNEALQLKEFFPQLFLPGGRLFNFNHRMHRHFKQRILEALQHPELDLAIFHAHGSEEYQYLTGNPPAETISAQVEAIRRFLRGKMRSAKRRNQSLAEAKKYYSENYGIPESWFEGAFTDSIVLADSLLFAEMDLHLSDVDKTVPRPRLIIFDECFNGAFIAKDYLAAHYLFGKGKTLTAIANSVNVLQDIWANEDIGMLNLGVRVGEWHKNWNYLESHLLGDPTWRFVPMAEPAQFHLPKRLTTAVFTRYLNSSNPALRAWALNRWFIEGNSLPPARLVNIYQGSESPAVRLTALKWLADSRGAVFQQFLPKALNDPDEQIRRYTARLMGDVGLPAYAAPLIETLVSETSERVIMSIWNALEKIGPAHGLAAMDSLAAALQPGNYTRSLQERLKRETEQYREQMESEYLPLLQDPEKPQKKRLRAIRTFRNYRYGEVIRPLILLMTDNAETLLLRRHAAETLGWFVYHYQREEIESACRELLQETALPEALREEVSKTLQRLRNGANHPLVP
ncbi:MAG: hypothetical protein Kow0037_15240 [Calditrichia bacterium]